MSELPLQWLRFCAEIVPKDIRENFMTAHILNPNSLAQKYLRRLYNFMAGMGGIRCFLVGFTDFYPRHAPLFLC